MTCETRIGGVCTALTGDAVAGDTYYTGNGCIDCHFADATGPPSIVESSCSTIFDKLSGAAAHVGGVFDGVTEQDAADIRAWIDSL